MQNNAFWRTLALAIALVSALLRAPDPAAAQDASPSSSSAWWATVNPVDNNVRCPATLAWLNATDVEQRDEEQATTDQLTEVATGPELVREQQRISQAVPHAERQWAAYSRWSTVGGTAQEAVIYATRIVRSGPADATGNERTDAETVDTAQVAYRMLLDNGAWRLADRHIFEQARHALNHQLGVSMLQEYQRLFERLIRAYNARDGDALQSVLDGQALEDYRAELQRLEDQQDHRMVQINGNLNMIDAEPSAAVMIFQGTWTYADADAAGDAEPSAQAAEPTTLVHRLELVDGQWKIVDEAEATTRRDADGTEHVEGCG